MEAPPGSPRAAFATPGRGGVRLIWELRGDKQPRFSLLGGCSRTPARITAATALDHPGIPDLGARNTRGAHALQRQSSVFKDKELNFVGGVRLLFKGFAVPGVLLVVGCEV